MGEPGVVVRRLDPDDDTAFDAFADIHRRAEHADTDHPVAFQPAELRATLRSADTSERSDGFLGTIDGRPVVAGLLTISTITNLDKAVLRVWVAPGDRRQGYGSAMAEALVARAEAIGRTTLLVNVSFPSGAPVTHPHRAFAARHGFSLSNVDVHRVLDLPVPEPLLARLATEAAPYHRAYELVEYVDDGVPPDVLPSYVELMNALMADAPTGDVEYEPGSLTPEEFHADMAVMRDQGRTLHRTVALDEHGVAVAHSVLAVPGLDPGKVFQFGTLVRREHRGHRLGLATKVRNVATVQALYPDRSVVHTWNAASNRHMIEVNEALGFRVVGETAEYVRRVRVGQAEGCQDGSHAARSRHSSAG